MQSLKFPLLAPVVRLQVVPGSPPAYVQNKPLSVTLQDDRPLIALFTDRNAAEQFGDAIDPDFRIIEVRSKRHLVKILSKYPPRLKVLSCIVDPYGRGQKSRIVNLPEVVLHLARREMVGAV